MNRNLSDKSVFKLLLNIMNKFLIKKRLVIRKPFLGKTLSLWGFHPRWCHFKIKSTLLGDVEAKGKTCFTNYPLPALDIIFQLDLVIIHVDTYNFISQVDIKIYKSLEALTFFNVSLVSCTVKGCENFYNKI